MTSIFRRRLESDLTTINVSSIANFKINRKRWRGRKAAIRKARQKCRSWSAVFVSQSGTKIRCSWCGGRQHLAKQIFPSAPFVSLTMTTSCFLMRTARFIVVQIVTSQLKPRTDYSFQRTLKRAPYFTLSGCYRKHNCPQRAKIGH